MRNAFSDPNNVIKELSLERIRAHIGGDWAFKTDQLEAKERDRIPAVDVLSAF